MVLSIKCRLTVYIWGQTRLILPAGGHTMAAVMLKMMIEAGAG